MGISFSAFLPVNCPEKTKVKFNMNAGDILQPAWDYLRDDSPQWIEMNAYKTKQANNNLNRADYLLAFAQFYPYGPEYYIFGGMYRVEKIVPEVFDATGYRLTLMPDYDEYRKRLIIKLSRPIGRDIYNKPYTSVERDYAPEIYELSSRKIIEVFRGYNWVNLSHAALQAIIKNDAPEWKQALSCVKGVYCITDRSTGQLYIGSAYGDNGGIWQRWSAYADVKNLTGGNRVFEDLKAKDSEYITDNFSYSILEIFDMRTKPEVIISRETYWKQVFQTVQFGMNRN